MPDIDFTKFPEWHSQVIVESAVSGRSEQSIINDELKRMRKELAHYKRIATRRGARMQKFMQWLIGYSPSSMTEGVNGWEEFIEFHKEAENWFDADGVPVED